MSNVLVKRCLADRFRALSQGTSDSQSDVLPGSFLRPERLQAREWSMSGLLRRRWEAVFVASALELTRPFLAPLYPFRCSGSGEGVRPIPPYVSFFLPFLARSVERNSYTWCAAEAKEESVGTTCGAYWGQIGGTMGTEGDQRRRGQAGQRRQPWFLTVSSCLCAPAAAFVHARARRGAGNGSTGRRTEGRTPSTARFRETIAAEGDESGGLKRSFASSTRGEQAQTRPHHCPCVWTQ